MKRKIVHTSINLVTAFAVTLFFSCGTDGSEARKLNQRIDGPVSVGTGINGKYIDSGKVSAHFKTPLRKDFSLEEFPYEEFPDGIDLTFYDENGEESRITSNYAIRYTATSLVDLRDNVVLRMSDSTTLRASQVYWDQRNKWVFTDQPYTLSSPDGSRNAGDLFDSNQDFTDFVSLNNVSKQYLKDDTE